LLHDTPPRGPDGGVAGGGGVAVGRTVVYHKINDVIDSHTEITVVKVEKVEVGVAGVNPSIFTNGRRVRSLGEYRVPVAFFHDANSSFTAVYFSSDKRCVGQGGEHAEGVARGVAEVQLQQVAFDCQLEMRDREGSGIPAEEYILAEATFDASTGASFCRLSPKETTTAEELASREDLQLRLKVVAGDFSRSYFVASEKLDVPFVPAFYVGRKDVYISAREGATEISVTGVKRQLQALKVSFN